MNNCTNNRLSCATCRYWFNTDPEKKPGAIAIVKPETPGICQRNPPQTMLQQTPGLDGKMQPGVIPFYPPIAAGAVCGEHHQMQLENKTAFMKACAPIFADILSIVINGNTPLKKEGD